jgi:hypothetical protein
MPVLIGILVVAAVIYYLSSAGDTRRQDEATDAKEDLRLLCRGDQKQMERLIALEMARAPEITRGEAARRAVVSLRRDHRA